MNVAIADNHISRTVLRFVHNNGVVAITRKNNIAPLFSKVAVCNYFHVLFCTREQRLYVHELLNGQNSLSRSYYAVQKVYRVVLGFNAHNIMVFYSNFQSISPIEYWATIIVSSYSFYTFHRWKTW